MSSGRIFLHSMREAVCDGVRHAVDAGRGAPRRRAPPSRRAAPPALTRLRVPDIRFINIAELIGFPSRSLSRIVSGF